MKVLKRYGPPGTGKTQAMLEDFERELKKVGPARIAFFTFTRAARAVALDRSGRTEDELPFLRTIHSVCYRQLGLQQGQMVKIKDLKFFGRQLGLNITGSLHDPWMAEELEYTWEPPSKGDQLLQLNHLGRHRQIQLREALQDAPRDLDFKYAKWFTLAYRDWKRSEELYDYTDLLTDYLERGNPLECDVVFVDEAQDLSALQWAVVHKLASKAKRLYLAGDDDQAIFTWAGASAALFNSEHADKVQVLQQSHRVPRSVQRTASDIISRVQSRYPKEWKPRSAEGKVQHIGYLDPAYFEGETFVLFRNHVRGKRLAKDLLEAMVPFTGTGSPLGDPEVMAALRGWSKFARGEKCSSREAWAMVNMSSSAHLAMGAAQASRRVAGNIEAREIFSSFEASEMWNVLHRLPMKHYLGTVVAHHGFESLLAPRVRLLSIHQSKGEQADTVVLDRDMARASYDSMMRDPEDEHRVWYVAVTRAKENLYLLLNEDSRSYEI